MSSMKPPSHSNGTIARIYPKTRARLLKLAQSHKITMAELIHLGAMQVDHASLTAAGVPRKKDGNKLGLLSRRRIASK